MIKEDDKAETTTIVTKTVTKKSPSKKKTSKKTTKRKRTKSSRKPTPKRTNQIDKAIIENFIALQKVQTNLSIKFDNLSERIDKLLDVFEISAKSLAEKDFKDFVKVNDEEVLTKLDELMEQNKVIAKGLIMIHERTKVSEIPQQRVQEYKTLVPRPMNPRPAPQVQNTNAQEESDSSPEVPTSMNDYTKSIAPPKEA